MNSKEKIDFLNHRMGNHTDKYKFEDRNGIYWLVYVEALTIPFTFGNFEMAHGFAMGFDTGFEACKKEEE